MSHELLYGDHFIPTSHTSPQPIQSDSFRFWARNLRFFTEQRGGIPNPLLITTADQARRYLKPWLFPGFNEDPASSDGSSTDGSSTEEAEEEGAETEREEVPETVVPDDEEDEDTDDEETVG